MSFSEARVTQMAAYLLQLRGGRMSYIKLLKLLYLAEREAMGIWGDSISGDRFVSMPHGPVLSQTYDLIQGHSRSDEECPWYHWIKDEDNHEVSLKVGPCRDDLDELSDAELDLLESVYRRFGHMKRFELVDYTHDYCAEWTDPEGSSFPIKPADIFRAVVADEEKSAALLSKHEEERELDRIKSAL